MISQKSSKKVNTTLALAEYLGLSRWTVSRALNGHAGVKAETVERVNAAMKTLGFSPNALARGLRGGKTGAVGICFHTFGTPVFSKKLIALQDSLRRRGYSAIIELIEDDAAAENRVIRHFLSLKVEGIIFVGGPQAVNIEFVRELRNNNSLSVLVIDPFSESDLPRISLDRGYAIRVSLEKLYELGHRKIAVLGIRPDVIYGSERVASLDKVSKKLGLEWGKSVKLIIDEESRRMDFDAGRKLGGKFLEEARDCSAIMAINDQVAIGAMRVLLENGLSVPSDVSLIGFDNLDCSSHLHPTLASVDQRIEYFTEESVEMLVQQIVEGPQDEVEAKLVEPELVLGESMAPAGKSQDFAQ